MPSFSLSITITPEIKDLILANGYTFGMSGCAEEPSSTGIKMICFYDKLSSLQAAKQDLLQRFPSLETTVSEIPDTDWNARWKASMQPALAAPGIWVSPEWLAPAMSGTDHWIKIEPKTAFGTGHHATTRLAAKGLVRLRKKLPSGFSLLDIGAGTGVLCFAAELCGAGLTVGTDIDPVCARNLAENRANNPSAAAGGFAIGSLDMIKPYPSFDCIVMNMLQVESQPLLMNVSGLLKSPGYLVWSGILIEEKESVVSDASHKGFILVEETIEEEWWCGSFRKE
jgi:ribosomal protein L11 methyltransferase